MDAILPLSESILRRQVRRRRRVHRRRQARQRRQARCRGVPPETSKKEWSLQIFDQYFVG